MRRRVLNLHALPSFLLLAFATVARGAAAPLPLALLPENPRYFLFRGQPKVIVTSGEHYGALVDRHFDFVRYFKELEKRGLNGTRTFLAYREQAGAFHIDANSLAPTQENFIAPWKRSSTAGYFDGGNKFDLDAWDDAYFERLHRFMKESSTRGIVVEANLFSCFYGDKSWNTHPFQARNNVNGVGDCHWDQALSLRDPRLTGYMDAYVRKLASELSRYDNVYFEICNEPYVGGVDMAWHDHVADVLAEALRPAAGTKPANGTGAARPTTHLISWNVANGSARVTNAHPAISLFNFHYASPPDAVAQNRHLNRPIGNNETGFRGTNDAPYRLEAWDFLIAAGALFNNLDYSFIPGMEEGTNVMTATTPGGGNKELRKQLGYLREFMKGFNLAKVAPAEGFVTGGVPEEYTARALAEGDAAWAIYLRPRPAKEPSRDLPERPERNWALEVRLPAGSYRAEWISPRERTLLATESFQHPGGTRTLRLADDSLDLALRIRRR